MISENHRDAEFLFVFERFGGDGVYDHQRNRCDDISLDLIAEAILCKFLGQPGRSESDTTNRQQQKTRQSVHHRKDFCSPNNWSPSQRVTRQAVTSPKLLYSSPSSF